MYFFFFEECIHLFFLHLLFLQNTLSHSASISWSHRCISDYVLVFIFRVTLLLFVLNPETMNQATPARKLEEVLHLAELCIEVLQQNEEHHAEVMTCFNCRTDLHRMLRHSGVSTEWPAHRL